MGSGPKEPALKALMPPRLLAPAPAPAPAPADCPAELAGEGGGEPVDAPADGSVGVAIAPPAAAPAAAAPAVAMARSLISSQSIQGVDLVLVEPYVQIRMSGGPADCEACENSVDLSAEACASYLTCGSSSARARCGSGCSGGRCSCGSSCRCSRFGSLGRHRRRGKGSALCSLVWARGAVSRLRAAGPCTSSKALHPQPGRFGT